MEKCNHDWKQAPFPKDSNVISCNKCGAWEANSPDAVIITDKNVEEAKRLLGYGKDKWECGWGKDLI
jgi:hypothetical protein